jgi:hypothetical protein
MIDQLSKIACILASTPIIIKGCIWLHIWWNKPIIVWGLFDCPSPNRADYFIRTKAKKAVQNIKFILRPHGQPSDWKVKITCFYTQLGIEHMQTINAHHKNFDEHKEVEFDLPATGLFRLTIESNGGFVGSLAPQNCKEIDIGHPTAKICRSNHKPPSF